MTDHAELTTCAGCGEEVMPVGGRCPICGLTTLADDIFLMVSDGEDWVKVDLPEQESDEPVDGEADP